METKRKFKLKKRYIVIFILVISPLIAGFIWQTIVSQKAVVSDEQKRKQLKETLGRDLKVAKVDRGSQNFDGQHFVLAYPGRMEQNLKDNQATKSADFKETLRLTGHDPRVNFVAMVLDATGKGKLTDYSAVVFRRGEKDKYTESKLEISNVPAIVFTKKEEGAEKVAFLSHKGNFYSFAASGQNCDEVEALFDQVISTVSLK